MRSRSAASRLRTLLALLLTRANEVVSADRLIDELWGAEPPQDGRERAPVPRLPAPQGARSARGDRHAGAGLRDPRRSGRTRPAPLRAARARGARGAAGARGANDSARRSASGAARHSPTCTHESFAQLRFFGSKSSASRRSSGGIDADLALGRFAELVGEVQALVRKHPLREALRAPLMQALYGSGRQAEALEVYRETRRLLVEELGIEPSPALQQLEQAILRQDPALHAPSPAVAGTGPRSRGSITVLVVRPTRSTNCWRSPSRWPVIRRASSSSLVSWEATIASPLRPPSLRRRAAP